MSNDFKADKFAYNVLFSSSSTYYFISLSVYSDRNVIFLDLTGEPRLLRIILHNNAAMRVSIFSLKGLESFYLHEKM